MNVYDGKDNLSTKGGIYIIFNPLDCKAYVGQAKVFNNRNHLQDLVKKRDNNRFLTKAFNDSERNPEFVYFVAAYDEKPTKQILNTYEKLYMTLVEELGIPLYNISVKADNRQLKALEISERQIDAARQQLINDFTVRFGKTPKELLQAEDKERREALEYYAARRLDEDLLNDKRFLRKRYDELSGDVFFFNRERLAKIIGKEPKSLRDMDMTELFFSKAGGYVGDGLDQILGYEFLAINEHNYCLWTLGGNAVHLETVVKRCREREKQDKPVYVLFKFTPSSVYAAENKYPHTHLNIRAQRLLKGRDKDISFLHLESGECVPDGIECTTASPEPALAFVVKEFIPIRENIDETAFLMSYRAVLQSKEVSPMDAGRQRSTFYLNRIDEKDVSLESAKDVRDMYFAAELAAPYIVRLD